MGFTQGQLGSTTGAGHFRMPEAPVKRKAGTITKKMKGRLAQQVWHVPGIPWIKKLQRWGRRKNDANDQSPIFSVVASRPP